MSYKLKEFKKEIKSLNGNPIAGFTPNSLLTFQDALVSICEMHQSLRPGSGETLKAYDLGIRIQNAKDSFELEESELRLLKKIISESRVFASLVIGRVRDYLNECKEIKVDKK